MKDEIPTIVYKKLSKILQHLNEGDLHYTLAPVFFLAEFACGRPRCPQGKEAGRDIWSLMENVGMYVHSDLPGHCNDTLAN